MRDAGRQSSFAGGARERRPDAAWGEGRAADDARGPRREFQPQADRPSYNREPTAPELDNQWRSKMRADAASPTITPDASVPSSPAQTGAPGSRPRLNLTKRTVSEAPPTAEAASSDKPNPFGAARPIDTAAREKEIEEKRQLALREKKEADDKARAEKKAREAAEKPAAKEEAPVTPAAAEAKEDAADEKAAADEAAPNGEDEDAHAEIVQDKAVKPQEVVRDPPKSATGSWRSKPDAPAAAAAAATGTTTTEALEDDGWSTVTKPVKNAKNTRRGGPPARAIAS